MYPAHQQEDSGMSNDEIEYDDEAESLALSSDSEDGNPFAVPRYMRDYSTPRPGTPQIGLRGGHGSTRRITEDITRKFAVATSEIANGRTANIKDWNLFSSIGALEIGDPKMDRGLPSSFDAEVLSVQDSRRLFHELDYLQLAYVIDIHLAAFMAWHRGNELSSTLLSSIYIEWMAKGENKPYAEIPWPEGPESDRASILKLFCITICKLVGWSIEEFRHSQVPLYEEEDISLQTHGRDFFPLVSFTDLHKSWILETFMLQERVKKTPGIDTQAQTAVLTRLALVQALLGLFACTEDIDERMRCAKASKDALLMIKTVNQMPPSYPIPVHGIFTSDVQKRLESNTPIRDVFTFDRDEYMANFDTFLAWFMAIEQYQTWNAEEKGLLLKKVLRVFSVTEASNIPYVKSVALRPFWNKNDDWFAEIILWDISSIVCMDVLPNDVAWWGHGTPRFEGAKNAINEFAHEVLYKKGGYMDLIKHLSSNPPRMRKGLCQIIETLEEIEHVEAPQADAVLAKYHPQYLRPLTTWTHLIKLWCMQIVIELGFFQNLYKPYEAVFMYSYLASVYNSRIDLISMHIHHMPNPEPRTIEDMSLKQLKRLGNEYKPDSSFLQGVYRYHRLLHYLKPPDHKTSHEGRIQQWNMRTRPFWNIATPACPSFDEIQLIVTPDEHPLEPSAQTDNERENTLTLISRIEHDILDAHQIYQTIDGREAIFQEIKHKSYQLQHFWNVLGDLRWMVENRFSYEINWSPAEYKEYGKKMWFIPAVVPDLDVAQPPASFLEINLGRPNRHISYESPSASESDEEAPAMVRVDSPIEATI